MHQILELLVPTAIKEYFRDIQRRLSILETLVDTLIESPTYKSADDAGFNGQMVRKRIFTELLSVCEFEAIVETGTWLGNTTGYMAETANLPIYTSEINPRFHRIAKQRLNEVANIHNIHMQLSDSRAFLRHLATTSLTSQCLFFYLDSHWYNDLPLHDEITLIANHWQQFVIMVDDFKVPHDAEYEYDRYGKTSLALDYIQDLLVSHQLVPFFPIVPASEESGSRRGCVVLARQGAISAQLATLTELRRY